VPLDPFPHALDLGSENQHHLALPSLTGPQRRGFLASCGQPVVRPCPGIRITPWRRGGVPRAADAEHNTNPVAKINIKL
jgi:hypothetical protein